MYMIYPLNQPACQKSANNEYNIQQKIYSAEAIVASVHGGHGPSLSSE